MQWKCVLKANLNDYLQSFVTGPLISDGGGSVPGLLIVCVYVCVKLFKEQ